MVCKTAETVAIGTACPNCGCEDAELVRRSGWWGQPTERVACRHCGREFTRAAEPPAETEDTPCTVFPRVACPRCGSKQTRVTSTRAALRWHSCESCQRPFKSLER
ncbi:MAG: hypothetical protein IPM64_18055 [Phycisphaerales bacterium]|nr:hypothetical protein [Phycisphaerales bacterium]